MKKSFAVIILLVGFLSSKGEEIFTPHPTGFNGGLYRANTLDNIIFEFDGGIKLLDGASAVVKYENEIIISDTRMEVQNSTFNFPDTTITIGEFIIYYDNKKLPKGHDYTIYVAPHSIAYESNGADNLEFSQKITIPANLGEGHFDAEDGSVISMVSESVYDSFPSCYWRFETLPVGNPHFILYRKDIAVRELPASITWDWALGQAHVIVKEEMRFEKGIEYSLVLPAGSAHEINREDIVNEEDIVFNFVGGYEGIIPELNYVWCNLLSEHSDDTGKISFYYDRPVKLVKDTKIQLWENEGNVLVTEADAFLERDNGYWIVSADFSECQLKGCSEYTFVIPEGSIIAESGDPIVNPGYVMKVSGIDTIDAISNDMPVYDLFGRQVNNPEAGKLYIQKGQKYIKR